MFSARIKNLRESKGLSQSEFAKVIGVERTRYGKWENKGFEPPYATLVKIADYFAVTTDYLLGRTDYPQGYVQKAPPIWRALDWNKWSKPKTNRSLLKRSRSFDVF